MILCTYAQKRHITEIKSSIHVSFIIVLCYKGEHDKYYILIYTIYILIIIKPFMSYRAIILLVSLKRRPRGNLASSRRAIGVKKNKKQHSTEGGLEPETFGLHSAMPYPLSHSAPIPYFSEHFRITNRL